MGRKEESLTKADAMATDTPRRRSARISVGTRAIGADLTLPSTKSTPDASNDSTNPYISASTTKIDDDMELDEIVVQPKHKSESTSQILKEVAVLMKGSSGPPPSLQTGGGHNRTFTGSPASISSGTTSGVDRLSGYNTPATSTFPTPAESTTGKASRLDLNSRSTFQNRSRALSTMSMAGKRKRGNAPDTSNDELLAQALQEEEYQELEVLSKRGKTNHHKITGSESVPDSEMEDVDTSDLTSLASLASPTPEPVMQRSRRGRQQTGRTAKLNAKSTIAKNSAEAVPASDLSEETNSDFREDSDVDDFTDDTDAESNFNSETTEDENSVPLNTVSTAPTARRRAAVSVRTARSRATRSRRSGLSKAERERLRLETQHPEIRTMWDDLKAIPILPRKQAKQPLNISRQLKPFQLEGLNWMIQQEKTQWKGGLLGDEMGMGKTIQAVSLIMSDYPAQYPTLVIVPPVALMQWQKEIQDYTDGKLKVLVYHNQRAEVKRLTREDLLKYDVIMISYASLESMHRKEDKGWRRGDDLIKEDSIIHSIHYHRLILDEAHSIKSRQTQTAKACFALTGDYKWCLSGTPVQNRIGEFFSLLRFLEVVPFACYFCKKCRCAELHWSRGEDHRCTHCHCASAQHVSVFNQEILNPITESESQELRREGLAKLRLITDRIMLRRVKRDHTTSMELPPKEVVIHNEFFGEIEHDFSMSIMTNTTRQFDTYVARGVMLNNYANIFGLIMQMRQIANHPDLILKKAVEGASNILVCGICDEPAEEPIRSGCRHVFCRPCLKHFVNTFEDAEGGAPDCPRCHARLTIDWEQADLEQNEDGDTLKKSSIINRINMEKWTSSTKIEMLVYELFKLRSKKQTQKSIVFSQFTSMLQLVEWRLRRCGFNTVMLDGSMTPDQRQKSIDYFMKNVNVEVFLVSLKAGGVALNLTEASRVFIIDPWWNPAAEWQSADRCHRIGQQRPCVVKRLVIEDSVESRMITLQEKKTNMINGTINNDQVAMDKLTPEDMQFLFRG